jgi:hypothetical protein
MKPPLCVALVCAVSILFLSHRQAVAWSDQKSWDAQSHPEPDEVNQKAKEPEAQANPVNTSGAPAPVELNPAGAEQPRTPTDTTTVVAVPSAPTTGPSQFPASAGPASPVSAPPAAPPLGYVAASPAAPPPVQPPTYFPPMTNHAVTINNAPPPPPPRHSATTGLRIVGDVFTGVGLASLGVGGYFSFGTKSLESSINNASTYDKTESQETHFSLAPAIWSNTLGLSASGAF